MTPEQLNTYTPQQISMIFQQREHVCTDPYETRRKGAILQRLYLFQTPRLNISET